MAFLEEVFRNLLLWIYALITVPLFGSLALVIRRHFWARVWCKGLLRVLGIRINAYWKTWLPRDKRYVFVANHQSQLDIPVLEEVLEDYDIRFLAKKSLFQIPFFGWGIKALGYIPIEREDPRKGLKSIVECVKRIKEGVSVVVFPEGTRSKTGELLPFKTGGFLIPLKADVPVVPVAILGTREILPKGSLWFKTRYKEVKVWIGEPIFKDKDFWRNKKALAEFTREIIGQAIEELKTLELKGRE